MSPEPVTLVIPGRNCASTIRLCLASLVPMLECGRLREIIFVDDGSTDATPEIVAEFPVTRIAGSGSGPGAARNIGWRAASNPLVWFVDSDCVAEPDALDRLLPVMDDPTVGGVSGSYGIMNARSLLACLIHEEIIERHRAMPSLVNFLATFNVLYRREALEKVGGFDERYLKAQDAELSFRVMDAGYTLRFVLDSRVKHFHEERSLAYLRTQRQQGYWRVRLHLSHKGHNVKDSYSNILDHAQPPLALLTLLGAPLLVVGRLAIIPCVLAALLAMAQIPLTLRITRRLQQRKYLWFAPMSFLRAYWRGVGMALGMIAFAAAGFRRPKLGSRETTHG